MSLTKLTRLLYPAVQRKQQLGTQNKPGAAAVFANSHIYGECLILDYKRMRRQEEICGENASRLERLSLRLRKFFDEPADNLSPFPILYFSQSPIEVHAVARI